MSDSELLFTVIICIGLFFVLRHLMHWYWKVNETVEKLNRVEELLEEISQKIQPDKAEETTELSQLA